MGAPIVTRSGFTIGLALGMAALGATPGVGRAAEGQGTQVLPGDATTALVADLDGDGANELVRILVEPPARHLVEAWGHDGEAWSPLGSAPIPSLASPSDGEGEPFVADASSLLIWQASGRARVLVLARSGARVLNESDFACCLSIFELGWREGSLVMDAVTSHGAAGDFFRVADLDADGTDELVSVAASLRGDSGRVEVLRWDGEAFVPAVALDGEEPIWGFQVGDTDGTAGDDLIAGPMPSGALWRIAWVSGAPVVDTAVIDPGVRFDGSAAAIADGELVLSLAGELRTVRWPRGGEPVTTSALDGIENSYPWVFGTGRDTLLALQEGPLGPGGVSSLALYDMQLHPVAVIQPTPAASRIEELFSTGISPTSGMQRYLFPWTGPMHGASPRRPDALVSGGVLITARKGGGYDAQPISPVVGRQPLGLAGPGDAWVALGGDYMSAGDVAYLVNGSAPRGHGSVSLVPVGDFLSVERAAAPTFALRNAVAVGPSIERATEILAAGPFEVVIGAPRGSWITAWDGRHLQELTVAQSSVSVEFAPPARSSDEDADLRASLVVTTPDGHVTVVEWEGTFVKEPPELSVAGTTEPLSLSARLEGAVGPHASVTVDGRPVTQRTDGQFAASVDAWPWPRRVEVVARDPLGNETVQRIEVVGLVDYRGLPWAVILGLATVGAGAALFLRAPRRRSPGTVQAGEGLLEELDPFDGNGVERR